MGMQLMKNVKDGSLMKGVKDGSRRLKDEIARSIGAGYEGGVDPVLEYRTQRSLQGYDATTPMQTHTYAQATAQLMHAFSAFFESQMQDAQEGESGCQSPGVKALAQSSLRVEEIQQSLQANVLDVAQSLQYRTQKLSDFDSAQRNAEAQKKSPPDFEKAQQKLQAATASLSAAAESVDADMSAIEARRDSALKNELLTVVASQIFIHSRANEHLQQLVPLLPGVAKPLVLLLAESARRRRPINPATSDVMVATETHSLTSLLSTQSTIAPFKEMHFAENMAASTYGRRQQ
ncbi:hypothetical protein PInf_029019 [Phytophthora infestans]|nr:hypothetical protein PInf_029019 [Phytophthora infestans]